MFTGTTSLQPLNETKGVVQKIKNGVNSMSEKQVDRVQSIFMWIIGGLMTLIMAISAGFVKYVVEKQDERIAALEEKYQAMAEANSNKLASMDKNLAIIAAKLNVDLKQ